MKIFDTLRALEAEDMQYTSNGWYPRVVEPYVSWILADLPDLRKEDCFTRLDDVEGGARDLTRVRSVIDWKGGDIGVVERVFGVALPDWVHAFYSQVRRALLCLRNPVAIMSPEEMVEHESRDRETLNAAAARKGRPPLPVRMIAFAHAGIEGSTFAFRQHTRTGIWEIALSSLDDSREEEQSEAWDTAVRNDQNFDVWIQRLTRTDGHPLRIDGRYEVCHTERWQKGQRKK